MKAKPPKKNQSKVVVAMSGGVDSSVTAALLKDQGYDVVGMYAKTWTPTPGDGTFCTWVAERRDALRVAAHLNIPLITVDLEAEYRAGVVDELFAGYGAGRTPNPDILCNRIVKFGAMYQKARALGAEYFATGHYARIEDPGNSKSQAPNPKLARSPISYLLSLRLCRGRDENKDQSYFLWDIPTEVLPHVLFPIGHLTKPDVRKLAAKYKLPVAEKKDSQGICFLGPTDLPSFLATRIPAKKGKVRDLTSGEIVGIHTGTTYLTIGQRHGVGTQTGDGDIKYVIRLDAQTNEVWVGPKDLLWQRTLHATLPNWLTHDIGLDLEKGQEISVLAQVRYRQSPQAATLSLIQNGGFRVEFEEPIYAPTPGQSIVFYQGDHLLGGAIIDRIEPSSPNPLVTPNS